MSSLNRKYTNAFIAALPHLYFLFYFILCVYYYKARLIYSDNAYFLFSIVQEESFAIFHYRWVGIFTQWIPLLMIKLSLPLETVAIGYSLNLALVYYLVFLLITYIFKKPVFALIIVALTGLLQHYAFFWQVSELNSGMPIFIFIVFLLYYKAIQSDIYKMLLGSIILSVSVFFIHPLLSVILITTLIGLYIYSKNKNLIAVLGISILALLLKYKFLSGFENGKIHDFDLALFKWGTIKSSYLYYALKTFLREQFYIAKIIVLLFGFYLLYQRKYQLVAYFLLMVLSTFLLIYYYLPNGEIVAYMETYFTMLFIPILICLFVILQNNYSYSRNGVVIIVIALSAYGLHSTKSDRLYKDRYKYVEQITNNAHDLAYIEKGEIEEPIIMLAWALPYETLLSSSIQGHSKSIYYNENFIDFKSIQDSSIFVGASWEQYRPLKELNQKYFKIQPQFYQQINGLNTQ